MRWLRSLRFFFLFCVYPNVFTTCHRSLSCLIDTEQKPLPVSPIYVEAVTCIYNHPNITLCSIARTWRFETEEPVRFPLEEFDVCAALRQNDVWDSCRRRCSQLRTRSYMRYRRHPRSLSKCKRVTRITWVLFAAVSHYLLSRNMGSPLKVSSDVSNVGELLRPSGFKKDNHSLRQACLCP
jgi:hypothetical protein